MSHETDPLEPAVEQSPRHPAPTQAGESILGWLQMLAMIAAALIGACIFQRPLADLEAHMAANRAAWLWATITPTAIGGALMIVGGLLGVVARGRKMSQRELEDSYSNAALGSPGHWARVRGTGASFDVELSFAEVKALLRSGAWHRSRLWQFLLPMLAGGLLTIFGTWALVCVFVPPWIKVLIIGLCGYALVRLTWAFWRA